MPLTTVDTGVLTDGSVTTAKIADGAVSAAKLGSDAPGMTLLGTVNTSSGSTATLTGLNLTNYKAVYIVVNVVSSTSASSLLLNVSNTANSGNSISATINQATQTMNGYVWIDLNTQLAKSFILSSSGTDLSNMTFVVLSPSVTTVTITPSAGSFDNGSILFYGVK